MKFEAEIIKDIVDSRGHEKTSIHYQSECVEEWVKEVEGAYPKLCDYQPEWLNYSAENKIGVFPYTTLTDVTSATVENVVPYAYKRAILTGQTLVNLFNVDDSLSVEFSNSRWKYQNRVLNLIGGNKYYVYFFNKLNNSPLHIKPLNTGGEKGAFNVEANTGKVVTLDSTITNAFGYYYFKDGWTGEESKQDIIDKCKILFFEYQEGMENWDIPYFEGMQSVKLPVLKTTGKNLFNPNAEFDMTSGTYGFIKLTDNKNNSISIIEKGNTVDMSNIYFGLSGNGLNEAGGRSWLYVNGNLTTANITNSHYGYFSFYPNNKTTLDKILQRYDIQFEESITTTTYEPYQSNILNTSEDVTLRGIGDVQDELNCLTGELTQRVDSIILKENGEITLYGGLIGENTIPFRFSNLNINPKWLGVGTKPNLLSTTFPTTTFSNCLSSNFEDKEGMCLDTSNGESTNAIVIRILKSRLISEDVVGIRDFISKTKIDIVSELNTPTIKTVDLSVVNQDGKTLERIKPIEGTMHLTTSGETIKPPFSGEVPVEAITQNLASFIEE